MPSPPPKPPKPPEDLAEVERALSVLQGRTPEYESSRREFETNRARRQAELDAVAAAELSRVRKRRLLVGGVAAIVAGVAAVVAVSFRDEVARRGRIEQAAAPFRAHGFTLVETTSRSEPSKLEASVPAGCVIGVASTGAGTKVRLTHAGGAVEGASPLLTCFCDSARVTLGADLKPGEGLALLRNETSALGGSRAFAFLPFAPGSTGLTDQVCAEASLDAWLDAKRWAQDAPAGVARPLAPVDAAAGERWFGAAPSRVVLQNAGFKVVSMVKREAPFAIVEVPAASCVLLATERATDRPSLRTKGGTLAIGGAAGDALWCTAAEALVLAQREGDGELAVLTAPAGRVGGLDGAREIVARAGLTLASVTTPPGDRGWNAKQLLLASAIPESLITVANAPDFGAEPDARIVALSMERPGMLVAETPADVFSFCDPQIDKAISSTCVFSGPQKWRAEGAEAVGGLARARIPFWLFGLENVSEPAALKLETELLALARQLRRDGFEPTTIEAVTELDKGIEVLGRANEDAVVAVGLVPVAPWMIPYTDGAAWSIEGEPRIVPIKPLERITLTPATKKSLPPKATRHTVVFRRRKH